VIVTYRCAETQVVEKLCETSAAASPIRSKAPKRLGLFLVDPEHRHVALIHSLSELSSNKTEAAEADSGYDA
jgi:hypothetical protein